MYRINDRLPYSIHLLAHIFRRSRNLKVIAVLCTISIIVILLLQSPSYASNASRRPKFISTGVNETTTISSLNKVGDNDKSIEQDQHHSHAFITSAYYYENSKSLGSNALAIVIVMSQKACQELEQNRRISIISSRFFFSKRSEVTIKKETTSVTSCEYIMTLLQSTTISNPSKIEIDADGTRVEVPFKRPRTVSYSPVVMCVAPQFVAEKWQIFLMNIHTMRRYGAHMHIYITSMVEEMFNTLKVFEKWNSITMDYWVRMKFQNPNSPFVEPNGNVEWRNQAGAQTDCLLQYKEVADFIAFMDIDDILIPRHSHNYHQEFSSHFAAYPNHHSIFYQKRDVTIKKITNVTNFSFQKMFQTMTVMNSTGYGKSIVDPKRYNSTWIHHSFQVPIGLMYKVTNTEIIHIKNISEEILEENPPFKLATMFGTHTDPLVAESDLQSLDKDFHSAFDDATFRSAAVQMFDHNYYSPIVFNCYNESFYHPYFVENKSFDVLCPNADNCYLPQRSDIKCIHSDATYISGPEMYPITFHYAVKPFWSKDIGCYQ